MVYKTQAREIKGRVLKGQRSELMTDDYAHLASICEHKTCEVQLYFTTLTSLYIFSQQRAKIVSHISVCLHFLFFGFWLDNFSYCQMKTKKVKLLWCQPNTLATSFFKLLFLLLSNTVNSQYDLNLGMQGNIFGAISQKSACVLFPLHSQALTLSGRTVLNFQNTLHDFLMFCSCM